MAAFTLINSQQHQYGTEIMEQIMPGFIGEEPVQEQALGQLVTIIITSGYKWISNATCGL